MIRAIAAFCALVITPSMAIASCAPGDTPSFADVDGITVHRYALVGQTWPRFDAKFSLNFYRGTRVVSATLDARRGFPIAGHFTESKAQTFDALRAVLQAHNFYALHLTPTAALYLDGPEDMLSVTRCGVTTTLGFTGGEPGGEFIQDNGQAQALLALLDDLQRAIAHLPWTPSPSSSP